MRSEPRRRAPDAGFVTAETAVALPALVLLAALLIWGVVVAAGQIRCVDAARVGARAAARGDADPVSVAQQAAPAGAVVEVTEEGETVRVTVEAPCPGPGRLGAMLSIRLSATAVAGREDLIGTDMAGAVALRQGVPRGEAP
ncbi:TadE family type IV pilus minor pilin [Kitasatospora sp. McL0602]|uniref:TadE family type IV pilus minor pilin n=1 Tax=Kitasatospora sp. McL0602 TaxID=3439530 RepID=UPI003F8CAC2B